MKHCDSHVWQQPAPYWQQLMLLSWKYSWCCCRHHRCHNYRQWFVMGGEIGGLRVVMRTLHPPILQVVHGAFSWSLTRSEERRVGKGCGCGWSRHGGRTWT